ncbi:hypothetical protein V1478_013301 [Vespula squamosa]|uniref:Uncharacterized protein n=1 Tax=Vespula squamosa TaxID=30214 RepID=A0ABD2AAJ2_VESSQ
MADILVTEGRKKEKEKCSRIKLATVSFEGDRNTSPYGHPTWKRGWNEDRSPLLFLHRTDALRSFTLEHGKRLVAVAPSSRICNLFEVTSLEM